MDTSGLHPTAGAREPDTALVMRCRAGDRDAFAHLVARYQSLVCSITYSGTGDLGLSQDLAQETFLAAWQGLGELREAEKLRAWLAGIARNLVRNAARRRRTDPVGPAAPLEHAGQIATAAPGPLEHAIAHEQEAVLRQALGDIPETYREPLVLFYREDQSVERVAAALELSVDATKQRLSRGRQMLRAQVAALVEETLARTRPGKAFTIAVLAALPAVAPQAATAGMAVVAAKGSTATGATALAGAVLGPLLGVLGAYVGARASIENTRSPRERRFMKRMAWVAAAYVTGFLAVEGLLLGFLPTVWRLVWAQVALWSLYGVGLCALILHTNRRQQRIRVEDNTVEPVALAAPPTSKAAVYGSLGGGVFGAVCWIFPMCLIAHDWAIAAVTAIVAAATFVAGARRALAAPERYPRIAMRVFALLGVLNLVVVNLRWQEWMVAFRQSPFAATSVELPLWAINLLLVGVIGWVFLSLRSLERRQQAPRG